MLRINRLYTLAFFHHVLWVAVASTLLISCKNSESILLEIEAHSKANRIDIALAIKEENRSALSACNNSRAEYIIASNSDDFTMSIEQITKLRKCNPLGPDYSRVFANTYINEIAKHRIQSQLYADSLQKYAQICVDSLTNNRSCYFHLAKYKLSINENDSAIRISRQALKYWPTATHFSLIAAKAYNNKKEFNNSINALAPIIQQCESGALNVDACYKATSGQTDNYLGLEDYDSAIKYSRNAYVIGGRKKSLIPLLANLFSITNRVDSSCYYIKLSILSGNSFDWSIAQFCAEKSKSYHHDQPLDVMIQSFVADSAITISPDDMMALFTQPH